MTSQELKERTKSFALRVIKLTAALPRSSAGKVIGLQALRSATSVAANYRAACRSRSRAEFVAKLGTVEEEADESCFWLEMIAESGLMNGNRVAGLLCEANELTAIMSASRKTARS